MARPWLERFKRRFHPHLSVLKITWPRWPSWKRYRFGRVVKAEDLRLTIFVIIPRHLLSVKLSWVRPPQTVYFFSYLFFPLFSFLSFFLHLQPSVCTHPPTHHILLAVDLSILRFSFLFYQTALHKFLFIFILSSNKLQKKEEANFTLSFSSSLSLFLIYSSTSSPVP